MKKKKYNGFWKWLFYVELIIIAFFIYVLIEEALPFSNHPSNDPKCASAICDCEEGVEYCECKYISNYYDDGEYDYETVTCRMKVEK